MFECVASNGFASVRLKLSNALTCSALERAVLLCFAVRCMFVRALLWFALFRVIASVFDLR